ncbi:transcriptional regulator GcvA [Novosphingobium pentaromativorans]|uniref:Transcriptional regulator, LysR family n=1 Tax=Novosphingobium pentaromativorans US6-1 TaxID=1088721 RepID=G6EGA3_9SPHN|nr:transcriptional regulator GcvA [Novosphingobium pentaromativorans]AIT82211.1 LysR family transcriptional regulator [Novosphingobium pentaromativorans US6-1]EHJ59792.1 transcriptional regulator, LysR family [Novosphingobium pentaromativorans US6-1]
MKRLPPLNALRAFEAAGRLRSIRRAAEELNVTPGAVSRQVQSLEIFLGQQMFRRDPREIVLTAEGEQYLATISRCLDEIRDATEYLCGPQVGQVLRIRSYMTFAMRWLIPRIGNFQEMNPDVEIRITTSNDPVDFERESVDAAVRLGDGDWPDLAVERLMDNCLTPVCSPAYLEEHPISCVADLAGKTLLHSTVRAHDWQQWNEKHGNPSIDPFSGFKYASSALAYQASMEGHGIAIAQLGLIQSDLAAGRLVRPLPEVLNMGDFTYYLVYPKNRTRNPSFRKFREWLEAEIASTHATDEK